MIGVFVLSKICEDGKVAGLGDPQPCALLLAQEVSRGEDLLMAGGPPVWRTGWTADEFVAIVEDDEGVGGMCGGGKDYAHFGGCVYEVGSRWGLTKLVGCKFRKCYMYIYLPVICATTVKREGKREKKVGRKRLWRYNVEKKK